MNRKKIIKFFLIIIIILFFIILTYKNLFESEKIDSLKVNNDENSNSLNIIQNIKYETKDTNGNEYLIEALKGEIDYSDPSIIFLTKVNSLIKLNDSSEIYILSDYGKYNSENLDTIFSENVIIKYLDNIINADYLDFSIRNNLMIISKNVIYNNSNNIIKADVVEINLNTKDTKIYMYENEKKVNIKSKK